MSGLAGRWAVITGASSGIGLQCAESLAQARVNLILVARRGDRLLEISKQISKNWNVEVLFSSVDVSDREDVNKFFSEFAQKLTSVSILVNNAGLAKGVDPVQSGNPEDWDQMIDTNIKGLLYFSKGILPMMVQSGLGDIVNMGSVAGRWTYAGGAVYTATKFAVRALTEGMRLDLMGKNIRVMNIEPGMVESEFSEVRLGDAEKAKAVYKGMTPLSPKDVAEIILWTLERPRHVNVQEMVVFPTDQASMTQVSRR